MHQVIANGLVVIALLFASVCVYLDAKKLGDDDGWLTTGKPVHWAAGVFFLPFIILPIYLLARSHYRAKMLRRKAQESLQSLQALANSLSQHGTWPPPPTPPVD